MTKTSIDKEQYDEYQRAKILLSDYIEQLQDDAFERGLITGLNETWKEKFKQLPSYDANALLREDIKEFIRKKLYESRM